MMTSALLHTVLRTALIAKPKLGQPAYWVEITRGDSNCALGYCRI